jgi:hypothetical protein
MIYAQYKHQNQGVCRNGAKPLQIPQFPSWHIFLLSLFIACIEIKDRACSIRMRRMGGTSRRRERTEMDKTYRKEF